MDTKKQVQLFLQTGHKKILTHLSIDCVVFGYHERQLKVLLLKWKNGPYSLPGGFIFLNETLEEAAQRISQERTGLSELFLQQFHTFGALNRSQRSAKDIKLLNDMAGKQIDKNNWILERTVSIGYYAVTEYSKVSPHPDLFSESCEWRDVNDIPGLLFDHNLMVQEALKAMRMQIYHQPIGYNLLPKKFTLPEIHDLYETILGKKLDRRNFPKKILSLGIIKKQKERRNIGPHRSPFLYTFDKRNYDKALKNGIAIAF